MENGAVRSVTSIYAQLQFGHGGEPWRTQLLVFVRDVEYLPLQFGHGGEPWRTTTLARRMRRHARFNSATAVNRGEQHGRGLLMWTKARFNSATAVNRGEPACPVVVAGVLRPCRFNSATAVNRGERLNVGNIKRRLVWLQFGHGGEPWRTSRRAVPRSRRARFNSATAVNRGERRCRPRFRR